MSLFSKSRERLLSAADALGWLNEAPQEQVDTFLKLVPICREVAARITHDDRELLTRFAEAKAHEVNLRTGQKVKGERVIDYAIMQIASTIPDAAALPMREEVVRQVQNAIDNMEIRLFLPDAVAAAR